MLVLAVGLGERLHEEGEPLDDLDPGGESLLERDGLGLLGLGQLGVELVEEGQQLGERH